MTNIDHGERAHSEIGASSASRWLGCPGSVVLSRDMPDSTSDFAAEGTAAHELSEFCLEKGRSAESCIAMSFNDFIVDEEMASYVQFYLDKMEIYTNEDSGYDTFVEARFEMPKIHKDMFGSNDFCAYGIENRELVIVDFKYGKGINVSAKENIQLIIYALGAYYDANHIYDFQTVKLAIVQPRVEGGEYDEWEISIKELLKYEKILKKGVKAVYSKKPKLASGDHCKWCKAKAKCPVLKSEVEELVNSKFDDVPIDAEMKPPEVGEMSNDQIAAIISREKIIVEWMKAVASHAHHKLEAGETIPGYKLVARKSNRKVSNEAEFVLNFADTFDIYAPRKLTTLGKLEKIIGKKEIAPFLYKPDTGTTIAVESDKRKAIEVITSEDLFNEALIKESYDDMEF